MLGAGPVQLTGLHVNTQIKNHPKLILEPNRLSFLKTNNAYLLNRVKKKPTPQNEEPPRGCEEGRTDEGMECVTQSPHPRVKFCYYNDRVIHVVKEQKMFEKGSD